MSHSAYISVDTVISVDFSGCDGVIVDTELDVRKVLVGKCWSGFRKL